MPEQHETRDHPLGNRGKVYIGELLIVVALVGVVVYFYTHNPQLVIDTIGADLAAKIGLTAEAAQP